MWEARRKGSTHWGRIDTTRNPNKYNGKNLTNENLKKWINDKTSQTR